MPARKIENLLASLSWSVSVVILPLSGITWIFDSFKESFKCCVCDSEWFHVSSAPINSWWSTLWKINRCSWFSNRQIHRILTKDDSFSAHELTSSGFKFKTWRALTFGILLFRLKFKCPEVIALITDWSNLIDLEAADCFTFCFVLAVRRNSLTPANGAASSSFFSVTIFSWWQINFYCKLRKRNLESDSFPRRSSTEILLALTLDKQ
jgi:hypothetical protein